MPSPVIDLLCRLIEARSVTPDDAGAYDTLEPLLQAAGFRTERLAFGSNETRDGDSAPVTNLWARWGNWDNAAPLFVFAGHVDVVPAGDIDQWHSDPFSPTIADGNLYGRGAADMKSGVAAMITAAVQFCRYADPNAARLAILLTSDEEGPAIWGTRAVVEWLADTRIDACLIAEPTCVDRFGDTLKVGRRGSLTGTIEYRGVQGHVAYPHLADNALHRLVDFAHRLKQRWRTSPMEPAPDDDTTSAADIDSWPTTVQIVAIDNDAGANNVIPAAARGVFNLRFGTDENAEDLKQTISALADAIGQNRIDWHPVSPPYLSDPSGALVRIAREVVEKHTGIRPTLSATGGTSDGRFLNTISTELIEFSCRSHCIHQVNEHVAIADVEQLVGIYEDILAAYFQCPVAGLDSERINAFQQHLAQNAGALLRHAQSCAMQYWEASAQQTYHEERWHDVPANLSEPIPEAFGPTDGGVAIIEQLHQAGMNRAVHYGGRYYGFVNGGMLPVGLAARWVADTWDQNAALTATAPLIAQYEAVCERWLIDLLRLPPESVAGFLTGSSMANIVAVLTARHHLLSNAGWDIAADGIFGAPPLCIVVSEDIHASVDLALSLAGFGDKQITRVPTDEQGRMRIDALPTLDSLTMVMTQVGNVNGGGVDPVGEICHRAKDAGAWVHCDGAFGLWARACAGTHHLTDGVEHADSWAIDAHKTLNTPYDCGILLCRHAQALRDCLARRAGYIHYAAGQRDPMALVPEMSRRARVVELWAILKFLGREGVDRLIQLLCHRTQQFAAALSERGFQIVGDVCFNQLLVRVAGADDARIEGLCKRIRQRGIIWCATTRWKGEVVLRLSVSSWETSEADIATAVDELVRASDMSP